MSRIPELIKAELRGVPAYFLENSMSVQDNLIGQWEVGLMKCRATLVLCEDVFPGVTELMDWRNRLKFILDAPNSNQQKRYKTLNAEVEYGISLLESTVQSPILKALREFLIVVRDGKLIEYYQRISRENEDDLIVKFIPAPKE